MIDWHSLKELAMGRLGSAIGSDGVPTVQFL